MDGWMDGWMEGHGDVEGEGREDGSGARRRKWVAIGALTFSNAMLDLCLLKFSDESNNHCPCVQHFRLLLPFTHPLLTTVGSSSFPPLLFSCVPVGLRLCFCLPTRSSPSVPVRVRLDCVHLRARVSIFETTGGEKQKVWKNSSGG